MSVTIKLYRCNADKRQVDKSNYLSEEVILNGNFTHNTNLLQPIISIDLNELETLTDYTIKDFNYCYVQEFNKYYYIRNTTFVTSDFVIIDLEIDVRFSNKDLIKSIRAYVARNQHEYNESIQDNLQSYTNKEQISYLSPSSITLQSQLGNNKNNSFVISTLNTNDNNSITIGDTSPFISQSVYTTDKSVFAMNYAQFRHILNEIYKYHSSDIQYIKSMYQLPFEFVTSGTYTQLNGIYINDYMIDTYSSIGSYVNEYNRSSTIIKCVEKVIFTISENYEDLNALYSLYIPFVGSYDINIEEINNVEIGLYYLVDLVTTETSFILYNEEDNKIITSGKCDIANRVNLSNEDIEKYNQRQQANAINTTLGVASSLLSIGVGVYSHNPVAVGGGSIALGSTIAKGVQQGAFDRPEAKIINSNTSMGWYLPKPMYLKQIKKVKCDEIDESIYGKPLNEYKNLQTLTGMTLLNDFKIESSSIQDDEKELLEQALHDYIIL